MFRNNISQFRIFSIIAVRISNLTFYACKRKLVRNESGISKYPKSRKPNISAPQHHPWNASLTPYTSELQPFDTSGTTCPATQRIFWKHLKFLPFLFVNIFNAGLQTDTNRNVQTDYLIAVFHLWQETPFCSALLAILLRIK